MIGKPSMRACVYYLLAYCNALVVHVQGAAADMARIMKPSVLPAVSDICLCMYP
jgi:hypothetical protein